MTIRRKIIGRQGEETAAQYLKKNGYKILCKNYICPLGELDLIAQDKGFLVFVEVRTRSGDLFGLGQESITVHKQHKLRQLAWYYLKASGQTGAACRFDVVAVLLDKTGQVKRLDHIENAF